MCRKGDNEELLLLCDGCDRGYHTYCCTVSGAGSRTRSRKVSKRNPMPGRCGHFCVGVRGTGSQSEARKWIWNWTEVRLMTARNPRRRCWSRHLGKRNSIATEWRNYSLPDPTSSVGQVSVIHVPMQGSVTSGWRFTNNCASLSIFHLRWSLTCGLSQPKLTSIPQGDWYCMDCIVMVSTGLTGGGGGLGTCFPWEVSGWQASMPAFQQGEFFPVHTSK